MYVDGDTDIGKVTQFDDAECYCCDCADLMAAMPDNSVDFILADPPYELYQKGGKGSGDIAERKWNQARRLDYIADGIDYDKVFAQFVRVLKVVNLCVFCSNKQVPKIMQWWEERGYSATLLVWDKPNPMPLGNKCYVSNLEFIVYVRGKGATYNNLGATLQLKSFRYAAPMGKERIHDTEKPVQLLSHLLLLHTSENDLVFDPYAGSFSTAIACHNEKRRFIGSEIRGDNYDNAMKRLKVAMAANSLF